MADIIIWSLLLAVDKASVGGSISDELQVLMKQNLKQNIP